MPIRALIVLLFVLNLGAAAWWLSRPAALPESLPAQPAGVPRLQLLSERASATPVPVVASAPAQEPSPATPVPPAPVAQAQCFSLGPFADAAAANAAGARLAGQVSRVRARELPAKDAAAYNVLLPPAADRESAQALAQRIGAAGFDDYL
ncbi:MAG: SPOR domain-containing protein, partial [Oxalobacteraceae bacterium]